MTNEVDKLAKLKHNSATHIDYQQILVKWIILHGIGWVIISTGYIYAAPNIMENLAVLGAVALGFAAIFTIAEWGALRGQIRDPTTFFLITFFGWFFSTFMGLRPFISPNSLGLIGVSIFWGGSLGLAQTIAWTGRVKRAYLWLLAECLFIPMLPLVQFIFYLLFDTFSPNLILQLIILLSTGLVYGVLTGCVLYWQLKHPVLVLVDAPYN